MKSIHHLFLAGLLLLGLGATTSAPVSAAEAPKKPAPTMTEITSRDFKTFSVREGVRLYRASFSNQYGMEIVGYMFMPANLEGKGRAIVIGHPMGASKEQASCVYASELASRGFVALAVDQIFWGESGGIPRHGIAPDLYAETFCAAVDFLGTRPFVDREKIGILGICGSGSFVISAAKIDPRMKAVATVSMYNIGEMRRSGIRGSVSLEQRKKVIAEAAEQRYANFLGDPQVFTGGAPFKVDENSPATRKASHAFYHGRGEFVPAGEPFEINTRSDKASNAAFMNFYPFNDIETISPRPMLFIMGEKAHSRPFTEDAYARAAEPKELVVVKDAGHFDLYDRTELIPFDRLERFFADSLK
ncbi:MAG: alpha/beta hydrolase [Desulfovibrionaceae bacterium]|nr:alpha/beta hydrolase [Desulfovibrionaceae bacterium]